MKIKRYHAESFSAFRRQAIASPGSPLQIEILETMREISREEFIGWLSGKIKESGVEIEHAIEGDIEPEMPAKQLSARIFIGPPDDNANRKYNPREEMWSKWQNLPIKDACSPAVWGYIVSRMIENKIIPKPYNLMANAKDAKSDGLAEIDAALRAARKQKSKDKDGESDDKANKVDSCVRAVLRRLCGLPEERATRSIYQDCPPARAWWQRYISEQVAVTLGKATEAVQSVLINPTVWGILTEAMASRLTVIGDRNIRDGIMLFLLEEKEKWEQANSGGGEKNPQFHQQKNLHSLVRRKIGVMCSWRALGFFEPPKIKEIVEDLAERVLQERQEENKPEQTEASSS